jgi:outer membrane protein OmpA-like peptidoglycan-associated protein
MKFLNNKNDIADKVKPVNNLSKIDVLDDSNLPYINDLISYKKFCIDKLEKSHLSVYFDADVDILKFQYYETLDMLVNVSDILEDYIIVLEGNCATTFSDVSLNKDNKLSYDLSIKRATSVYNYLLSIGIDPGRMVVVGNGSNKPLKTNLTELDRKYNRRVDISFKPKEE